MKSSLFFVIFGAILFSSCGFQYRQYTQGNYFSAHSISPSSQVVSKNNDHRIEIAEDSIVNESTEVLDKITSIPSNLTSSEIETILQHTQTSQDTTHFPKYHQDLEYYQDEQWQRLSETEVNIQLKQAREDAWTWILCLVIFGIVLILGIISGDPTIMGFEALGESIRLNREIRKKIRNAKEHPLKPYWYNYMEWTRLILWSPVIITGALLLIPYILYLYAN